LTCQKLDIVESRAKHAKIAVERSPIPTATNGMPNMMGGSRRPVPPAGMVDNRHHTTLSLPERSPNRLAGETTILHQAERSCGFSCFVRGMLERKEHEEELTKAVMDARKG
jgi:hypothetical protein